MSGVHCAPYISSRSVTDGKGAEVDQRAIPADQYVCGISSRRKVREIKAVPDDGIIRLPDTAHSNGFFRRGYGKFAVVLPY